MYCVSFDSTVIDFETFDEAMDYAKSIAEKYGTFVTVWDEESDFVMDV